MRDRLQELQAARGNQQEGTANGGQQGHAIEMGQMSGQSSMDQFFQEIQYIQDTLGHIQTNVARIEELHQQSLVNISDDQSNKLSQEMDYHVSETRKQMNEVKGRIKAIEIANQKVPSSSGDLQIRKSQVEQQFRQKYRERMERQYRIVCPNATQAEVDAALDSNTGNQLFAQDLLHSTRHGEAKRALQEVQERHEDIRRIEQTILASILLPITTSSIIFFLSIELHTLFQEMQTLVESQGQMIDSIEGNVTNAVNYTEAAVKHIDTAIVHRKNAPYVVPNCPTLILIIIIVVVVYVYVIAPAKQATDVITGGNNPSPSPSPAAATPSTTA
ncbi:t-SNARE [Syncephalis plumigaleata]|nr:t-SNARE [Syncephalis plumigaleata]